MITRFCITIKMAFIYVLPIMIALMLGVPAQGQDAGKDAYDAISKKKYGDFASLKDVSPVQYIRSDIPQAKTPQADGEYFESTVPDTLDLAERARLFIDSYLNRIVVPHLDYEPFDRGTFKQIPPRLFLSVGSYQCALPKYRESLPLLRIMSGSQQGLEIDQAWAETVLRCIGPDGLFYIPLKSRPWDSAGAYEWWPKDMDVDHYAQLWTGNGRLLGALSIYYRMTGDEVWNQTAKGIVDRLNELAITIGDEAFFPKFVYTPGESYSKEDIQEYIEAMYQASGSESEKNSPLWQTWVITGLAQYYRVSKYEPAKDLAYKLANYMRKNKYIENWHSHFHCISLGMHALCELAFSTGDLELAREAQAAYEEVISGRRMTAFPEIGFFVNGRGGNVMEGCSIADMTAVATKLAMLGLGDQYWEHVDRYVRNILSEAQFTNPESIRAYTGNLAKKGKAEEMPLQYNHLADDFATRMVGAWSLHYPVNNKIGVGYWDPCCTGNCSRAIYYVWENILDYRDGVLTVRLLLNRASQWADVVSYIPNRGRVDLKIKQPVRKLRVRFNDWVEKDKVKCFLDGTEQAYIWRGSYLALDEAIEPDQSVRFEFPIAEQTRILESWGEQYTAVFRGNECVDLSPKGEDWPMFQREHFRTDQSKMVTVQRFTSKNPVVH